MDDGLSYGLLGPVAAWRDGAPLELGTPQQQRVLALLLLHRNDVVSTDRLLDALWPEELPRNALQTVRTYVSRLRGLLGVEPGAPLESRPGGYRFAVERGRVDVDRFEMLALEGRTALEAGDPGGASWALMEALGLVRGTPLAGLEYDDFAREEIARLEELRLVVLEDLFEARLLEGRHLELLPELRAAVGSHPLRERFSGQLMLALYRSGRQAEALEAYRRARDLLDDELGLEPSRDLRQLERMILLHDRALDHDAVGRLHGVPRSVTSLVGRDRELTAVRELLRRERLVTIVGPAGSGKTRLAAEVAPLARNLFPDGVWWVDLSPCRAGDVPPAFVDALEIRGNAWLGATELVVSRLRGARLLLVLDTCEHVAGAVASLLATILEGSTATILATSREPLRVAGEHVWRLPPLSTPTDDDVGADRLMEFEAARLLVARASTVAAGVTLDETTTGAIAAIVARLDGLPLAIELAAGKLRALSVLELRRALEQRLDILAGGDRTAPGRHASLSDALSWSFDLLNDRERRLLERLSAFPGRFDARAAVAVGGGGAVPRGAVLPTLAQLVDKSLVSAELGDPTRYRLLETVRVFTLESAERSGELEQAARRHDDYFGDLADDVFRHMLSSELGSWLARTRAEQSSFSAALHRSLERGDGERALRLASALGAYWFRTGALREERALLDRALTLARADSPWRARGLVAKAWLSVAAAAAGAEEDARAAVAGCRQAEPALLGLALAALADCLVADGKLDEADRVVGRARAAFDESGLDEGRHLTVQLEGEILLRRGDSAGALARLRRARDLYREHRGNVDAGWTLVTLAEAAIAAGELAEATTAASEAVEDFQRRGDPRGLAAALVLLGRAFAARDECDRARDLLREAGRLAERWEYRLELESAETALRELDLAGV